jgi:hypothetical protein
VRAASATLEVPLHPRLYCTIVTLYDVMGKAMLVRCRLHPNLRRQRVHLRVVRLHLLRQRGVQSKVSACCTSRAPPSVGSFRQADRVKLTLRQLDRNLRQLDGQDWVRLTCACGRQVDMVRLTG